MKIYWSDESSGHDGLDVPDFLTTAWKCAADASYFI